ncbi:hypothetical protein Fmac_016428 [Flemingia macrophylla]|uniref:TLC domain-containing protein n=1 Tax=Flemingia macrophylla TaxID=520843 RepID=A0ABD1MHF1_9FABA
METHLFTFLSFFLATYLFAHFVVFRKWSPDTRPEASSCFISLLHGTPAVLLAAAAILSAPSPSLAAANTAFQSLVLDYSAAYFLADLLHLFSAAATVDPAFVLHHLATLFVLLTCRHVAAHGAVAVLSLLALAEATSAVQNTWALSRARRSDAPAAARLCDAVTVPFYAAYTVVRGVLGPCVVLRMARFYWSGGGEGVIRTWVWVSWVVVVSIAIVGSVVWVSILWVEVYRERWRKVR